MYSQSAVSFSFFILLYLSLLHTSNSKDLFFKFKSSCFIDELQFAAEFIFFFVPLFFSDFKSAGYGEPSCWFVWGGIRVCCYSFVWFFASNHPCYADMVWVEVLGHTHKSDCLLLLTELIVRGFYNCDSYVPLFNVRICKITL